MAEYIDKNEIGAKIQASYIRREVAYGDTHDFTRGMRKALKFIQDMPAADVQPVDRWISVDDALPDNGEIVLIYYNNQFYTAKYNSDFAETMPWSGLGHWWGKELISFWLPIPEPPETTKG